MATGMKNSNASQETKSLRAKWLVHVSAPRALLFFFCWQALLSLGATHAFPTGAGSCRGGQAAVGGAHVDATQRPIIQGSTLDDGGFVVTFGDMELSADRLGLAPLLLETNKNYRIDVRATQYAYKGVLVRLEPLDGQDTTGSLMPLLNVREAEDICEAPVVGVTHTSSQFKQLHSATINMSEPGEIFLDITIVGLNNATASLYGYDAFRVKFGELDSQETSAPVTTAPITAVPTESPTTAPTMLPLETVSPTEVPLTDMPTDSESTSAPVLVSPVSEPPTTMEPTSKPTATTTEPVQTPTVVDMPTSDEIVPVQQLAENMEITFSGVSRQLTLLEQENWEALTQDWFDAFYNGLRRLQEKATAEGNNYGVVMGSMTNMVRITSASYVSQSNKLILRYDHEYSYEAKLDMAYGPLQYATLPFRSNTANAAYSDLLEAKFVAFANMKTPVAVPILTLPDPSENTDDSLSGGAIAGICISVLIVTAVIIFAIYKYTTSRDTKDNGAVLSAQEIDREALTFDATGVDAMMLPIGSLPYAVTLRYVSL